MNNDLGKRIIECDLVERVKVPPQPAISQPAIPKDIEFVHIPAGTFLMGEMSLHEGPVHEVHIPAFQMSKYPITCEQYVSRDGVSTDVIKLIGNRVRHPITNVNWYEAKTFAEKIGCRLPTEAEWEYACRAGTRTRFYTGDRYEDLGRAGWHTENSGNHIHLVGEKKPNAFGLYDMHGNVWEWCEDDWHDNYVSVPVVDGRAWVDNPRNDRRVLRGGSYLSIARDCRSAYRGGFYPEDRLNQLGFRVVVKNDPPYSGTDAGVSEA